MGSWPGPSPLLGEEAGPRFMIAQNSEQAVGAEDWSLQPTAFGDAPVHAPSGFAGQGPEMQPAGYMPTSLMMPGTQSQMPVPGLGVGRSGVDLTQSAGSFPLLVPALGGLQGPLNGLGNAQLQPLLAVIAAAQQWRGLLTRASSCEVPAGSGRKLPHKRTPNILYKTELCRTWSATGQCRYGGKCQFAHGFHELRPVQRHPKYKTEVCRTFATTGSCPYGARCKFIHGRRASAEMHTGDMHSGDDTPLAKHIVPEKAHSLPANFGSTAGAHQAMLLNALRNLMANPQHSASAPSPGSAGLNAGHAASLSSGLLAESVAYPANLMPPGSQLGSYGQAVSSPPFNMPCQGVNVVPDSLPATSLPELLQSQDPALSPLPQDLGMPYLPADISPGLEAPGTEMTVSSQLPMELFPAAQPSISSLTSPSNPDSFHDNMQGAWNLDGLRESTGAALLASDPQVDPPFMNQACKLYAAVAKGTAIPA